MEKTKSIIKRANWILLRIGFPVLFFLLALAHGIWWMPIFPLAYGWVCFAGLVMVSFMQVSQVLGFTKAKVEDIYSISYYLLEEKNWKATIKQVFSHHVVIALLLAGGILFLMEFMTWGIGFTFQGLDLIITVAGYYLALSTLPMNIKFKYYQSNSIYDQGSALDEIRKAQERLEKVRQKALKAQKVMTIVQFFQSAAYKDFDDTIKRNRETIRRAIIFLDKTTATRQIVFDALKVLLICGIGIVRLWLPI